MDRLDRRTWVRALLAGPLGLALASCQKLTDSQTVNRTLDSAETLTRRVQGLLVGPRALAPEFSARDISPDFKANGTTAPDSDAYQALAAKNFADWRLEIGGLVERPLSLSLADLRAAPGRSQI